MKKVIAFILMLIMLTSSFVINASMYNGVQPEVDSVENTVNLYVENGFSEEHAYEMIEKVDNGYIPYSERGVAPVETIEKTDGMNHSTVNIYADGSISEYGISGDNGGYCQGGTGYFNCYQMQVYYNSTVFYAQFYSDYSQVQGSYGEVDPIYGTEAIDTKNDNWYYTNDNLVVNDAQGNPAYCTLSWTGYDNNGDPHSNYLRLNVDSDSAWESHSMN